MYAPDGATKTHIRARGGGLSPQNGLYIPSYSIWAKVTSTFRVTLTQHKLIEFEYPPLVQFCCQSGGRLGPVGCIAPGGGTAIPKRWGCAARAPWSTWREIEREIKKFMVTKRKLLNNLSNIGGTFSLGDFFFDERENYQV